MSKGYLCLVLHAHLPFVRHPEYEEFLEEDWLYQAITETYIPLIRVFGNLIKDDIPFKITMSLSPTLLSMLGDPLLQSRYIRFLDRSTELAEKEINRTKKDPNFHSVAWMYKEKLQEAKDIFENRYTENLVEAFKNFQDQGNLEIITCGATHGYLPLMHLYPGAMRAQIQVAVQTHEKFLGRKPKGIWLPECAYEPGIEKFLKEAGIDFFFLDTHGILHANPRPKHGVYAPLYCENGVAAFGRDIESSKQVWSSKEGYPGDFSYRDFYRDIGFDLEYEYIRPYIATTGDRKMTGFKYHRITNEGNYKEVYCQKMALEKAADHAGNFMFNRERQIEHLNYVMGQPPIVVAPYDAELFGHWWYEGPDWLNYLIRRAVYDQNVFELITPSGYLEKHTQNQVSTPTISSWGFKGFHEHWLSHKNDWIYRHLHKATERMIELSRQYSDAHGLVERTLNQAARELLLAQSSDWAFIMFAETMVEYAIRRTKGHLHQFNRLYDAIKAGSIDERFLISLEEKNNIFPDINFRVFS